jgi:threonine/homoserine/homoserine lactone efflux protein
VNDSSLWLFVVVAAGLTLTPGADTLLVIKNSLRGGRHAGWATTLGISAGLLVHAAVSALGLSTLLAASPGAMAMIQVLGAAYLVVLGVQALRGGSPASDAVTQAKTHSPAETSPWSAGFYEGLLTNLLPQFIAPGQPVLATSLGLASIHVAMGALWLGLLAAMLARGRSVVSNPQVQRRLTQACGLMLLGLGVRLLVTAR